MRQIALPDGASLPVLGLGSWRIGESPVERPREIAAVRSAIELGYRLIDTAEMYGEGGAEAVIGTALREALRAGDVRRDELTLVSKVYPHNASRSGTQAACERSLQRLGLDCIDLYLLHWRGSHPLRETIDGMHALIAAGKVRRWGVSNFDTADMQELLAAAPDAGCAVNQVYYSLRERGAEFSLLPWLREQRMPLMAYCPIDQGRIAGDSTLAAIGQARGLTAAQVALAWIVSQPGVVAIPKAVSVVHLRENLAAADLELTPAERQQIEARFKAPRGKTPLAMS